MELSTKDQFYNILNDQHITDDEYDHAKKVWKTFTIKTMGEYHDLYLVSDVLLLTDVSRTSERPACNTTIIITKNDLILNSTPENRL